MSGPEVPIKSSLLMVPVAVAVVIVAPLVGLERVTVYVPKDMKYQDFSQHLYIDLKKGEQHLNGEKFLQFARFRYDANGDIGRIQRQQQLMRSLVEQTLKPATLLKIPDIIEVIRNNIDTNLSLEDEIRGMLEMVL